MKPYITACTCLLHFLFFACTELWSQPTINLGLNLDAGSKGFPRNGKRGLGGSVEYVNRLWKQGGVRVYAGYDWFNHRQPENIDPRVLGDSLLKYPYLFNDKFILPLRFGYQQFLFKDAAFVYAEARLARWKPYPVNKRHLFTYALGTGYRFNLKENQYIQLSFLYNQNLRKANIVSGGRAPVNTNYFTLRTAYGLHFGKKVN